MTKKETKPKPPQDKRPQAERFIETARQIGADETGKAFEKAFEKIVPSKQKLSQL